MEFMISAANDFVCGSEIDRREKKRRGRRKKRNSEPADGFDLEFPHTPSEIITSSGRHDYYIDLYGRLGLHCYNFQKGKNYKFLRWEKFSDPSTSCKLDHYITIEAIDPVCNSVLSLQTLVSDVEHTADTSYVIDTWRTYACRRRCNKYVDDIWDHKEIDEFYIGEMPKWLSDDDESLHSDDKKYYVVQESELHENDWLHLLMEFAFLSKTGQGLLAFPPLDINKVVLETREEYITEAREKLKAENVILYISYKFKGVSTLGFAGDHKAIIRRTMDGKPGHMTLEVASLREQEEG